MKPQLDPSAMLLVGDRILVRRYERPPATASGIIIPEAYREDMNACLWEVVQASLEAIRKGGVALAEGDIILGHQFACTDTGRTDLEGRDLLLLTSDNVLLRLWEAPQAQPLHTTLATNNPS